MAVGRARRAADARSLCARAKPLRTGARAVGRGRVDRRTTACRAPGQRRLGGDLPSALRASGVRGAQVARPASGEVSNPHRQRCASLSRRRRHRPAAAAAKPRPVRRQHCRRRGRWSQVERADAASRRGRARGSAMKILHGMRGWYDRLPIHRKLVVLAVAVTTAALALAVSGLVAVDVWRYRSAAEADTRILASVIAENSAAAVVFKDPDEARDILAPAGARPSVRRTCLYLADNTLFARFEPSHHPCPASPAPSSSLTIVAATEPIVRNHRMLGTVYVERELADLWPSIVITVTAGLVMLVLAGIAAV